MSLPCTAYVTLWFPKGSETFVVSEVKALHTAGLPLSVHCLYGPLWNTPAMLPEGISVERLGLAALPRIGRDFLAALLSRPLRTLALVGRVLCSPGGGLEKYGENLLAVICGLSLARRFRQLGVEHIHAAWANGSATASWCASMLLGIPFSFSARAGDVHPSDGMLVRKLRDAAFARVDSAYNLPHLRRFIPEAPNKVQLVYNAHTLAPISPEVVGISKARGNDTTKPLRLVAIGRFIETKGFQHLITALGLLRNRGIDARLTLAGDGPWRGHLKAATKRLGLTNFISFPGFVPHDRISALLRASDMLVMPSVHLPGGKGDGLPTVIVEALLHRLPVVATRVASIPDLILHGETGLLAPERDPIALADAIQWLVDNRQEALDMAAKGCVKALEMFAPEACAAGLIGLITGTAAKGRDVPGA